MKPRRIDLHIEHLVLHGFAQGDRHRIGAAVKQELVRLMTGRGLPESLARGGAIPQLDGGAVTITPSARPEANGAEIARAVYGGMRGRE